MFEVDLLGPCRGGDPDTFKQGFHVGMQAAQAGAQHLAALVEAGRDDLRQDRRIGRKARRGEGGQVDDGRVDLRRRGEGFGRKCQDDLRIGPPLGEEREAAIGL
jgi:hypothetical protein